MEIQSNFDVPRQPGIYGNDDPLNALPFIFDDLAGSCVDSRR